jgi:hypothetical protein
MRYALHCSVMMMQNWGVHSDVLRKQIPDEKAGDERVDAVVVDEEAIGSVDRPGCGAKILRGDGALGRYITRSNMPNSPVWSLIAGTLKLTPESSRPNTHRKAETTQLFCTTCCNICFDVQETNEAEVEDAYMLSRIVSL